MNHLGRNQFMIFILQPYRIRHLKTFQTFKKLMINSLLSNNIRMTSHLIPDNIVTIPKTTASIIKYDFNFYKIMADFITRI